MINGTCFKTKTALKFLLRQSLNSIDKDEIILQQQNHLNRHQLKYGRSFRKP